MKFVPEAKGNLLIRPLEQKMSLVPYKAIKNTA